MSELIYNIRYIARVDMETTTPLTTRSGEKNWVSDQLIYRDAFGLPGILGTSITGILRSLCGEGDATDEIFGRTGRNDGLRDDDLSDDGFGARLMVSNAYLIGKDNEVVQTVEEYMRQRDYLSDMTVIMERDHVRINHKGIAEDKAKYDEEILPAGARFRFELSLQGNSEDDIFWNKLMALINSQAFVLGGGTRNGKGQVNILKQYTKVLDLRNSGELEEWLQYTPNLNQGLKNAKDYEGNKEIALEGWVNQNIQLKARDFFITAGIDIPKQDYEGRPIDKQYKTEKKFSYTEGYPKLKEEPFVLLPSTSVKGALSHRVAYHYNMKAEIFADQKGILNRIQEHKKKFQEDIDQWKEEMKKTITQERDITNLLTNGTSTEISTEANRVFTAYSDEQSLAYQQFEAKKGELQKELNSLKKKLNEAISVGEDNPAVRQLFGFTDEENNASARGNVIIQDVYLSKNEVEEKLFNHVKIDRFTGGAFNGALFNEVTVTTEKPFELKILVKEEALKDFLVREAWEAALTDLKEGRLPLGGGTMKGHGVFEEPKN
ncbi:RAMP superfamily CRISPR-associated protein [Algivirga pacifica]|uniref:CRISPR type III-associated protein domain-containing protein n=1 Tax=Algivirga pacifica TaxID=1162670 RepID=A0ABP9D8S4_9BACT